MHAIRNRLPNRRQSIIETIEIDGQALDVCVGFDRAGQPLEVFLSGAKRHGLGVVPERPPEIF